MNKIRILLVEDDRDISKFIQMELEYEGYLIDSAYEGRNALEKITENNYDIIILDVMLPTLSGMEILRRIRKSSSVPVIMLTAKDDINSKVMGLDIGASDYMTKPFDIEELLARIRVIIRDRMPDKTGFGGHIIFKDIDLNTERRTATIKGQSVPLTKNEYVVLEMLLKNIGEVVKREDIIDNVWGGSFMGDSNAVDVYISHLRSKIEKKFDYKLIHTVRGIGYTVREDSVD